MGNLVPIIQVETQRGEILLTLNLNLNIKLDPDGNVSLVGAKAETMPQQHEEKMPDMKNVKYEKPDMANNSEIISFGKQV